MAVIGTTNVLVADIRDVLLEYDGTVTNDTTTFFTEAAGINMWSRYKPVVISNVPFINLWDETSAGNYAFMGDDLDCGITIPYYSDYTTLQTKMKAGEGMWTYTPPTGGTSQPRRLGDFRLYNPDAINPIGSIPGSYYVTRESGSDYIEINIELNVPNDSEYNLGISDFSINQISMSSMYLGVYLVKTTGKEYFRTYTSPIGTNDAFTIKIPLDYGEGGTFTAYMFVSSKMQGDELQGGGTLATINKPAQQITIKAAGTSHVIIAAASVPTVDGKSFDYEVTLYNNTTASVTFQNVYVRIQHYIDGTW